MKTRKIFFLFIIASLSLVSCIDDFLEKQPTEDLTLDEVFQQRSYTEQYLNNIYSMLPTESNMADASDINRPNDPKWLNPFVAGSDEMEMAYGGAYAHLINDGSWNPSNITQIPIWTHSYRAIRKCNIFLNRIGEVPMEESARKKWIGEVYFLRAFFYFQIFRTHGPFIIIDKEIATDEEFLGFKRSPVQDCVNFIVSDCDRAVQAGLTPTVSGGNIGRVTSVAVLALKSRTLLYMASPLWNGNIDYAGFKNHDGEVLVPQSFDINWWQRAADAAKECIDVAESAGYGLYRSASNDPYQNYSNIWQEFYNKEWIFFKNVGNYTHLNNISDPVSFGLYSITNPTQELVDAYEMADGSTPITGYSSNGTPIINAESGYKDTGGLSISDVHPKGYHPAGVHNMYVNREPRFYASINFARQLWKENPNGTPHELALWNSGEDGRGSAGSDYCKTGYLLRKMVDHQYRFNGGSNILQRVHIWVYFRMGEIYLNYAEALNELNRPNDALIYINEIRDRAGLSGLSSVGQLEMRERIKHERRIELAFETHRFFDVRRWKDASTNQRGPIHGLDINAGNHRDDDSFYKRVRLENRVFTSPRHYLFPIPENDFNKVKATVVQNPGWTGSNTAN